jgi:hypothetical protein
MPTANIAGTCTTRLPYLQCAKFNCYNRIVSCSYYLNKIVTMNSPIRNDQSADCKHNAVKTMVT